MSAPAAEPAMVNQSLRRHAPAISARQLVGVELRKMFNTRSGFWLLWSVLALSIGATVAVIVFAPDSEITYEAFAKAFVYPSTVILPIIAILAVTSEWSQRSGLTTFTLVPSRGRVIWAKAAAAAIVGIVSMLVAFAVGAIGNLVGAALVGISPQWDVGWSYALQIVGGNLIGMAIGFTLGVVLRNSAAAIVGYFVVSFVISGILVLLAQTNPWFTDLQSWIDWNATQVVLFDGQTNSVREWAQLAVTTLIWIVLPFAAGMALVRRSEIK